MPKSSAIFLAITAIFPPFQAAIPAAELIGSRDLRASVHEALEAYGGKGPLATSWPRTGPEICRFDTAGATPHANTAAWLSFLHELCGDSVRSHPLALTPNAGAYGLGKLHPLGVPFESFGGNWSSVRTDPELARAWTEVPAAAGLELRYAFSPRSFAYFRMGLRRDLAAWHEDPLSLNVPFSAKEVDLNEPSLGYFNWAGEYLDITAGRLPIHWSPSRDFGLMLSDAVPYHNAVQAVLKAPRVRYLFLVSSLNPWLEGTPPGDVSGTGFPVGSEQWRQRNYPVLPGSENAHKRVYDAPMKTLIAHRLEAWAGPVTFGVTESNIIGGKTPDLRDANPFAVFHNDFHEGYSNNNVSVDAALRLPAGLSLAAEAFMDDLQWSDTEGSGASPSLLGWLGGVAHHFAARGWFVRQSLHCIRTDPFLYGFLQPLNTYTSRHVLTSNFQQEGDPVFVDKYVVDYPIGYLRGADAFDFWYRIQAAKGPALSLALEAALLSRGEAGTQVPFERYYLPHGSSPSGIAEREARFRLEGAWRWRPGRSVLLGAGWQQVRDEGHVEGRDSYRASLAAGAAWTLP